MSEQVITHFMNEPMSPGSGIPEQALWDSLNEDQKTKVLAELNKDIASGTPRLDAGLIATYLNNISAKEYPDREDLRTRFREIVAGIRG